MIYCYSLAITVELKYSQQWPVELKYSGPYAKKKRKERKGQ